MKISGSGGSILKDGEVISNVISFDFSESDGDIVGEKRSEVSLEVISDSETLPFRHGDMYDLILKVSRDVSWSIKVSCARIESAQISVAFNRTVNQSISLVSELRADIA